MGVSVTDFCCGRTQANLCRKCGRDFRESPHPAHSPEVPDPYNLGLMDGALMGAGAATVIAGLLWLWLS